MSIKLRNLPSVDRTDRGGRRSWYFKIEDIEACETVTVLEETAKLDIYTVADTVTLTILETSGPGEKFPTPLLAATTAMVSPAST